jgi:hypothetical protein
MVAAQNEPPAKSARPRPDGRKTLLVYLDGELIKNLKKAALDDERNVYEIVEEAARDWLERRIGPPFASKTPAAPDAKRTRKRGSTK